MEAKEILLAIAIRHQGDWDKIFEDVKSKNTPSQEEIDQAKDFCEKNNIKYLTMLDENYPEYLRSHTMKPPFVLFYKGDITLINNYETNACVVGSRDINAYNKSALTGVITREPSNENVVISLTKGTSEHACNSAINFGKKVIAFKSVSMESNYPYSNNELEQTILDNGGLVLSEVPTTNGQPNTDLLPTKYRLMASVSKKIIVSGMKKYSSGNIVISYALNSGKDIDVVPQPYESEYANNNLIAQGANILLCE